MFKEEFGIDCQCIPKDDDRDAALAESTCRIVESMTKNCLIRMNLNGRWWMLASKAGKWLLNRLPTHSNLALSSPDGDRPPPPELFTRGWYSRDRIRKELTAFSLPGTVILVHRKQGGSKLAVHGRWLVVRSMLGDHSAIYLIRQAAQARPLS